MPRLVTRSIPKSRDEEIYEAMCARVKAMYGHRPPSRETYSKETKALSSHQGIVEIGKRNRTGGL